MLLAPVQQVETDMDWRCNADSVFQQPQLFFILVGHYASKYELQVQQYSGRMHKLLQAPDAHVYVCGDSQMVAAVSTSFMAILGASLCANKHHR